MSRDKDRAQEAIYKALHHPLRRRILQVLRQAGEPLAPLDVTERLGEEKLSNVSYHFRVLADLDLIEISEEEAVRGAVKHFYVLGEAFPLELGDTLAMDQIADLLKEGAAEISEGVLNEIVEVVVASGRPIR